MAVKVRDIKDCKVVLGNISLVWDMTLRHWVTAFRCFVAKYCPNLQGNNIRTEYSAILLRNLQNMHKLHFFVRQQSKSGLDRRVEVTRSLTIRHTHRHTHTPTPTHTGRNSLNEWTDSRYLHNMQQTRETNIHALNGMWNLDPSNLAAADLRLRPQGHQNRHTILCECKKALMA
jgi:hypothetical protein